jgi:methyltransferase family protein
MAERPGSAPVYDTIGHGYTTNRQPDPRWVALISRQLDGALRIVNVGAGTGSYEPVESGALLIAVEPSAVMIGQRPPGSAPALRGSGTALPLPDRSFDAALAILTLHHWGDWTTGLHELARVAPRRVILTIDFAAHAEFWLLRDYLPEVAAVERTLAPSVEQIANTLRVTDIIALPLPADMIDGVLGAHWKRPEAYLDPIVRANTSPLALADPASVARGITQLEADLSSGIWHERYVELLELDEYDAGYRLVISNES